ncbi:MFS transporter [Ekhidna sp.]|uniref:NTP/NDP exchange transporter n=1 Tax=Ekhidna sp. TaxID=2608089 RepID=UPI00329A619C
MIFSRRIFNLSKNELRLARSSFLYFFFLMSSYFILRPVRDEMGIEAGVDNMQWLFTGTFTVMLFIIPIFGFLMKKVPRHQLLPKIYVFFITNILLFYLLFKITPSPILAACFFIWLSVFNLFVISIFWSFNADLFSSEQAKRLYGPISAGGSCGAIFGPLIATYCVGLVGINNLLLISAGLLAIATLFLVDLVKKSKKSREVNFKTASISSVWQGLLLMRRSLFLKQIGLFILLYTSVSTFLYFEQAHIISDAFTSSADRTFYFGTRDLLVNSFTLILQFFLTERFLRKAGIVIALMIVPLIAVAGFLSLGLHQAVITLLIVQVLYRSLNFSIQRPSRELLFTGLTIHEKYNSKNFIDTVIYRGGDAISGWLFTGLNALISSLHVISLLAVPIAAVWMLTGFSIGKIFNAKTAKADNYERIIISKKSA